MSTDSRGRKIRVPSHGDCRLSQPTRQPSVGILSLTDTHMTAGISSVTEDSNFYYSRNGTDINGDNDGRQPSIGLSTVTASHNYHTLLDTIQKMERRLETLEEENERLKSIMNDASSSIFEDEEDGDPPPGMKCNLCVSGYGDGTTKKDVTDLFSNYMEIQDVTMKDNGSCIIHCANNPKGAVLAKNKLQGTKLNNKPLKIRIAKLSGKNSVYMLWKGLRDLYKKDFNDDEPLVLLHPYEVNKRMYTKKEISNISRRPFCTRMYITNLNVEWNTVWLRTRYTDHAAHTSTFVFIRDYFKADMITKNPTGAKYCLTELLNMCFGMPESDYYSFACTLASALSNHANNTSFEIETLLLHEFRESDERVRKIRSLREGGGSGITLKERQELNNLVQDEQERARKRLVKRMDIFFTKVKVKRHLVDKATANIYRLVLCMTKYNDMNLPFFYSMFTFLLQFCIILYVIMSLTGVDGSNSMIDTLQDMDLIKQNIGLAAFTFVFSSIIAWPELRGVNRVFRSLYRKKISLHAIMDAIVNVLVPILVAIFGFFVVLGGETFLDGVLNTVALLFIAEIDDLLPRVLDLDVVDIVQSFLVDQAMDEYEGQSEGISKEKDRNEDTMLPPKIEFSDIHVTNTKETGTVPKEGITFAPYEILKGYCDEEDKITSTRRCSIPIGRKRVPGITVANKQSVTADCLLRKVEWQYTRGYDLTTAPRIGHLKLHKLNGSVVEIKGKQIAGPSDKKPFFSVTGVYVVTSYQMSDDIIRLRICGSQTVEDFRNAFDYYNLWPLDRSCRTLLSRKKINPTPEEQKANTEALYVDRNKPVDYGVGRVSAKRQLYDEGEQRDSINSSSLYTTNGY